MSHVVLLTMHLLCLPSQLRGDHCDTNWLVGAFGRDSQPPAFSSPAPALFGFEDSLYDHCSALLGANGSKPELASMSYEYADFDDVLAHRCVAANMNILRLKSVGWHMCHNLRWGACAAQAPVQRGGQGEGCRAAVDLLLSRDGAGKQVS